MFAMITMQFFGGENVSKWNRQCLLSFIPSGNLLAASGPFVFFFFLPTLVGIGGSYFFFLSFCLHKLTSLRTKELQILFNNEPVFNTKQQTNLIY